MGFIVELVLWVIIEVLFWGIMFWTGYLLSQIFTLGHLKLAPEGTGKIDRSEPKFIVTALIGTLFWIGLWVALTIAW